MSQEKLKLVVEQILNRIPAVKGKGEQATKQSLVIPMIDALGYDIWNPTEVCPEYEADFAIKKAGQKEKVDIAIILADIPRIYIEVKPIEESLDKNEGQLARYFNATTSVTLGILTNGVEWRFFTDTGDPNIMDSQPFHTVKIDAADQGLEVLARFAKSVFSAEAIRDYATELRYTAQIASFLRDELDLRDRDPSEYFVRWVLKSDKMYDGVVNANVVERFRPITKAAMTRVIREIVRRSITAMEQVAAPNTTTQPTANMQTNNTAAGLPEAEELIEHSITGETHKTTINTTERELDFFSIIKSQFEHSSFSNSTIYDASCRKDVPISISYKDTSGYLGIYFNKPSWWLIRACIETKKPWIGFNISDEIGTPLIPIGMAKLDPHPYADFRVQIEDIKDADKLHKLIYATFGKVIDERAKNEKESELKATI
ncbi:MAG TPA: type I restriction endonuclease [Chitinispirillaceae bacterium]|nr:type I restriction endonuclease [Chitinispirillaceae bacterium]